jgi:hypothetical protein
MTVQNIAHPQGRALTLSAREALPALLVERARVDEDTTDDVQSCALFALGLRHPQGCRVLNGFGPTIELS